MRVSSFDWNRRYALGVIWKPPRLPCSSPCCSAIWRRYSWICCCNCAELLDVARLGELRQLFQVDDADLGRLGGLFELLEQLVDRLQLLLDLERLRHGHRLPAGELVLAGQLIDLVLFAEALDEVEQVAGELAALVAAAIPEPFEVVQLLVAHRLVKVLGELAGRLRLLGLVLEGRARGGLGRGRLVGGQDAALALFEDLPERLDARAEAANLPGVDVDGVGEFFLGESAHVAVGQQVLEGRGDEVRRRAWWGWENRRGRTSGRCG